MPDEEEGAGSGHGLWITHVLLPRGALKLTLGSISQAAPPPEISPGGVVIQFK